MQCTVHTHTHARMPHCNLKFTIYFVPSTDVNLKGKSRKILKLHFPNKNYLIKEFIYLNFAAYYL